ncbi:triose-phosphate isomerase family protein [Agromyces humatus]|uniref:Triosephosphate isomerase n=1 Tax=Agromyces humatus TaxID=279573 RepID=A0ABN2L2S3_9MICO|nr:triose-phosphate isomerase family protein [Agromyces humatus]
MREPLTEVATSDRPRGFIGVSTKAYLGQAQTVSWLDGIAASLDAQPSLASGGVTLFVIPAFPLIPAALERLSPRGVVIGAQTVSWGSGALTGEVSAGLLAEMGVGIVEIGHAERRAHFGETDEIVARKVRAALDTGLTPLLCIGETDRGTVADAVEFCRAQVASALGDSRHALSSVVLAYEPIWAIGASEPAPAEYVSAVVAGLRAALHAERPDVAHATSGSDADVAVIYGGSAGPGLLRELPGVDGLFLGRFAHDPSAFVRVAGEALELRALSAEDVLPG